ncbi:phosphoglycerate mutase-like protein [Cucurbitaria berberidis CBS 394.84]|uniref:Phosphoglycerate mutase-like protein n=1 Tax=Cucurbitaria berberidis CBS 394.84 TaxID=1168544 RepID=A0A9P4L4R5_9PLEO|nr:phosphoglycerate mutase-like protein [Cucurbitaria berberidis CBS 394.84]KAF1841178.1 phosphoglycerate mutase-like protein [Cucurbitaria berberidis CBS 394.84]
MFALAAVTALASAWLVGAQEQDNNAYHPHASFVFMRTGERTPIIRPGPSVLSALGANQMYTLGQNFRTRYITGQSPSSLGQEHIAGMSPNVLNNEQILVKTLDTEYLVASAQAFMQGLYPPRALGNGTGDASGLLADGRAIDYPLNGYQYASVKTSSQLDPDSIYIAGAQNCPVAQKEAMMYFTTDEFLETKAANKDFYKNLSVDWFEGNLKSDQLDYISAYEIADYLAYQYAHNSTIYRRLANDSTYDGVYDKIRHLADQEAWYLYGNTSSSSTDNDNRAIAGKTLAAAILDQFQKLVTDKTSGGDTTDFSYPLTFYVGEQEPMMSLMSLMKADSHDHDFRSMPPFGSAMVFELFSTGDNVDFPTNKDDLWVRFYFHNGTEYENNQMMAFPIFGNGPSRTDMPWKEFKDMFAKISVSTLTEWCGTCASPSLFCWGVDNPNVSFVLPGQHHKSKLSPTVAGIIGAIVTLAVAGFLFALAMLLAGVRFHRNPRSKQADLGGFKGSAKLASDPDLSLAQNAAAPAGISFVNGGGAGGDKKGHERVGSWELRQKELGPQPSGDFADQSRRGSFDAIDAVAGQPVQPHERV